MRDAICKECCPYGCDAHFEEAVRDSERLEWLRKHIDSAYTRENIDKAREAVDEAMKDE